MERVQIEGRDEIGHVVERWIDDGKQYVTAVFGLCKISAPVEMFSIVCDS